jgi:hypothetical protein
VKDAVGLVQQGTAGQQYVIANWTAASHLSFFLLRQDIAHSSLFLSQKLLLCPGLRFLIPGLGFVVNDLLLCFLKTSFVFMSMPQSSTAKRVDFKLRLEVINR